MAYNKPNLLPGQFVLYAINRIQDIQYHSKGTGYESTIIDDYIYIPLTFFDGQSSAPFSTYDENLQAKENGQYSLTFSVAKYLEGQLNPIFYLLTENRRIRLQTHEQKIDFVITQIAPNFSQKNVVYSITCQDVCSYDLAKHSSSIDFANETPQTIAKLAADIISTARLDEKWKIDNTLEMQYYADFPSLQKLQNGVTQTTHRMTATLSLSGTTPYNALVELCKKFNADMSVEYSDNFNTPNILYFTNKVLAKFNGYHLRDNVNLSAFSVSKNASNFCSIMHVNGGEDVDGNIISITPTMPVALQTYFTMLKPYKLTGSQTLLQYLNTVSFPFAVIQDGSTYKLYRRYEDTSLFLEEPGNYIPWTLKSTADIEQDFNSMCVRYSSILPTLKAGIDTTDYFNFLKYRCPAAASFFYSFDYYRKAGLMDEQTFNSLTNIFNIELRNANIQLFCVSYQYNSLSNRLMDYEAREEDLMRELCALEEEEYDYKLHPNKDPGSILTVTGTSEDSALSRTTIEQSIKEAKAAVINRLTTEVWKEEYFTVLLTLRGNKALDSKIADVGNKLTAQETKFSINHEEAKNIVNASAAIGYLQPMLWDPTGKTKREVAKIPKTPSQYTFAGYAIDDNGRYELLVSKSAAASSPADGELLVMSYKNAVLDTEASITTTTWPEKDADGNPLNTSYTYAVFSEHPKVDKEDESLVLFDSVELTFYTRDHISATECQMITLKPRGARTLEEREEYLSATNQTEYINYSVAKSNYQKALNYIKEQPKDTDPTKASLTFYRRGLYAMTIDYLIALRDTPAYGFQAVAQRYQNSINLESLLSQAKNNQQAIWKQLYNNYGDFIAETSFSDGDQLSSEGLFMAAMKAFSQYSEPTYQYNATVIDARLLAGNEAKDIKINDMVYIYHKEINSQYTGRIKVTIPRYNPGYLYTYTEDGETVTKYFLPSTKPSGTILNKQAIGSVLGIAAGKCLIYTSGEGYSYPYSSTQDMFLNGTTKESITGLELSLGASLSIVSSDVEGSDIVLYIKCPAAYASILLANKEALDIIDLYTTQSNVLISSPVLDIEMEEIAVPIPLQVTGVTKKLREATSQLTVSTDRTMDLIYQRLLQQARL